MSKIIYNLILLFIYTSIRNKFGIVAMLELFPPVVEIREGPLYFMEPANT
jgi:hypothetical protein